MKDNHDHHGHRTSSGRWKNPRSISAAQFAAIEAAAAAENVMFEVGLQDGHPLHFWQKDHILVTPDVDEHSNEDLRRLGAVLAPDLGNGQQVARKDMVKLLRLENLSETDDRPSTADIVAELDATKELGGRVFVNNLMYVTHEDGANLCPAAEPLPRRPYPYSKPYPPHSGGDAGKDVRITVIDTGLPADIASHGWLFGDQQASEVHGEYESTYDEHGDIASHAGHGMFIAGLIRCVAPRAKVTVANSLRWVGAMTESGVAQTIMQVLDSEAPPDIISLSAGYLVGHKGVGGPSAMRDVMTRLQRDDCRTVLVAATGNDGHGPEDHGLFYPAAFAHRPADESVEHESVDYVEEGMLVAVGALREDRKGRACFSNYGAWVTVYEEGENLVNVFPSGSYVYREPVSGGSSPECLYYPDDPIEPGCTCLSAPAQGSRAVFTGMAAWSGTSFATPLVVGRIARHITELGGADRNPRAAVKDLLKQRVTITDAGDGETALSVFPQPAVV